jgi:hypothetical protein
LEIIFIVDDAYGLNTLEELGLTYKALQIEA